jgi:RNA polymerase sigma-70 factor (ECF subfamily)
MNEWADQLPARVMSVDGVDDLAEREFADRLSECAGLAVRVAYSVMRNRQDAEDVAQEAFARAHRKFQSLREPDRFRAWLIRIVWRIAIDRRRSDKRRLNREQAAVGEMISAPGEVDAIDRQRAEMLWQAIDALPEKLRIVVVLCSIEGHTVESVASTLGAPVGTIKSRLFDARKNLQEALQCLNR